MLQRSSSIVASSTLDAATLGEFRAYSSQNGVVIPDDAASTAQLAGYLAEEIAYVKFGDAGLYRLIALTDPAVSATVKAFDRAGELLGSPKPR